MAKKSSAKKKTTKTTVPRSTDDTGAKVNLRTAAPSVRVRAKVALAKSYLEAQRVKLADWSTRTENEDVTSALDGLSGIINELTSLDETLADLVKSNFALPRRNYTATTGEGDHVAVLEDQRVRYLDIVPVGQMLDMEVIKKYPGRAGGLIVETKDGHKLKVALSHVSKLT